MDGNRITRRFKSATKHCSLNVWASAHTVCTMHMKINELEPHMIIQSVELYYWPLCYTHKRAYIVLTRSKFIGKLIAKTFLFCFNRFTQKEKKQPKISQLQCESNATVQTHVLRNFNKQINIDVLCDRLAVVNHCKFGYLFLVKVE